MSRSAARKAPAAEPAPDGPDRDEVAAFRVRGWFGDRGEPPQLALTRFAFLRGLGFVYLVAFGSLYLQLLPLFGAHGLLPVDRYVAIGAEVYGSRPRAFLELPSLFWITDSDFALELACWTGVVLSALVLVGVTNAFVQLALWLLYMSFVHVGQIFFGYGWELLMLETGFLSVFLCPIASIHPFPARGPPALPVWLLRWLTFRLMLGAGLIKLRGDSCWVELSCLVHHYETQPNPNPLSPLFHAMPRWFHQAGALVNHAVELLAPWFLFGPRRARLVAATAVIVFQATLIASGNLSFLNWLSIVVALGCLDDEALLRLVPRRTRPTLRARLGAAPPSRRARVASYILFAVVALLSLEPALNMMSREQKMNTSFERLHLVNTYGAFGSVNDTRYEVVVQGTSSEHLDEQTEWRDYELPCKPGDPQRRPCWASPYHYRLDWQMWFLPGTRVQESPWFVHFVYELLMGEPAVKRLLAKDPFPDAPPRYIRAELYRYEFSSAPGLTWQREKVSTFLRPVGADDPELLDYLEGRRLLVP